MSDSVVELFLELMDECLGSGDVDYSAKLDVEPSAVQTSFPSSPNPSSANQTPQRSKSKKKTPSSSRTSSVSKKRKTKN